MAAVQVFYDDPAGTAQIDNFQNVTLWNVDTVTGALTVFEAGNAAGDQEGRVASYSHGNWKRIKIA